jgi:arylsulfatase A-like enzyme
LFDFLGSSGLTRNSYIFVTSDHGETFERGDIGHFTRLIFDPLIHVPLFVSMPGQTGRQDIYSRTSNVDLLPTLAHLTGNPVPNWAEGTILPGLGGVGEQNRSIFVLDAKQNSSFEPLTQYSASLTKGDYRLTYYVYPPKIQRFELYNLAEDPEELSNLFSKAGSVAKPMQDELLNTLLEADRLYRK